MNDKQFTEDDLERASAIRNKSLQKKFDALSAEVETLASQRNPEDARLIAQRDEARAALESLTEDSELVGLRSRVVELQQQATQSRQRYESDLRHTEIHRLAVRHNAVSAEQLAPMLDGTPTEFLEDAVLEMKEHHPNLFRFVGARGIGGGTSPAPAGNADRFQTGNDISRMSDADFMKARKAGKLDRFFGRK